MEIQKFQVKRKITLEEAEDSVWLVDGIPFASPESLTLYLMDRKNVPLAPWVKHSTPWKTDNYEKYGY